MSRGRVLLVDDEPVLLATLREFLEGEGFEIHAAADGEAALGLVERVEPDLVLCDIQLPGADGLDLLERVLHLRPETLVVMITAYATVESAVAAFRRGAHDYLLKPVLFDELLAKLDHLLRFRGLVHENRALRRRLHEASGAPVLVGHSPGIERVRQMIRKLGPMRSNVLITGESGTGKELVARALHDAGRDPEAPFLAVNCAAIPHELIEGQLFGHVRGAFTGADRDGPGLFVAAGEGTLFLDEIAELPLATQVKLLRAIESREVLPVGATRPVPFAARLLAATNQELVGAVHSGRFRADLYYRLNVVTIALPPLRDRPEDIPGLIVALLARLARELGRPAPSVENATVRRLMAARWPGNVRELANALERALILADGPVLSAADFPAEVLGEPAGADPGDDLRAAVADFERRHIARVLDRCGGDKREAARRLGMGLSSLYRKLEES
jgi:DNA-binding NtrC family response regulator